MGTVRCTPSLLAAAAIGSGCTLFVSTDDLAGSETAPDAGVSDATPPADVLSEASQVGVDAGPARACADLMRFDPRPASGVYTIDVDGDGPIPPFRAFCDLEGDGGGWTLLVKVDGASHEFNYDSNRWTSDSTYRPEYPDLDLNEAKLAGFSTMPFESMRVGVRELDRIRWLVVPIRAASLRLLFLGEEVQTTLGRAAWLSLIESPTAQSNCNAEGINLVRPSGRRLRIGIFFNNQSDCDTIDSFVGLGSSLGRQNCGNWVSESTPGTRNAHAFGYVLVR